MRLLCSQSALDEYGAVWRTVAPTLQYTVLPTDRRLEPAEIDGIDLAVFTADLWNDNRGPSFFKVLLQAGNAKWLHMFSAGVDNPVFGELRRRGMRVTHSAGSSATPIAHTVIMHTIALHRDAATFARAQGERRWAENDTVGATDVEGRTMGIVGLGSIGAEVARIAQHLGMRVIGLRRTPQGDEPCETWPIARLHDLLPLTDTLVLTAALTDDTRHIIGARELALLPQGAHLVNVGRGLLVDEAALVESLQQRHLGGAALDVFEVEPLPADSPLWDLPNVIVTPHSAGGTPLAAQRAADVFATNLGHYVAGEPMINEVP